MNLDELRAEASAERTDTVLLAVCDTQGRLQGKRMTARHFLDEVVRHGAAAPMNPVDGGDVEMRPDLSTLRRVPWHEATALCLADITTPDGSPVATSPRRILRRQIDRLAERGWEAYGATKLQFMLFEESYEQAWDSGYRNLTPANRSNADASVLATARVEPLVRRIRNAMTEAEMAVESSTAGSGRHEITFRYGPALRTADDHVVYKNGAKEVAAQEGKAITYMAKYDERDGNACHIHLSLRDREGDTLFGSDDHGVLERFIAGLLATLRELTLFLAPNVNSYKRFAGGTGAVAWGLDNRTCAVRVVGDGASRRVECRLAGADVNPYLALAALVAGGLHGIDHDLSLEPAYEGDASGADKPRVPSTLREASELFECSRVGRDAFGEEVVAHAVRNARAELAAFEAAVTDWERFRGFERL